MERGAIRRRSYDALILEPQALMYDPRGIVKQFKLQAHAEACKGTPESISNPRDVSSPGIRKPFSSGEALRLTPEPVPHCGNHIFSCHRTVTCHLN
jgi:hypothetical protein